MPIKKGTVTIASSTPVTEWGSIEGVLSDQADLKNTLATKAPTLSPEFTGIPTVPTASEGTNTNQIASTKFVNTAVSNALENIDALPEQSGNNGKFLTTNGTIASWGDIPSELPSQYGQSGKVLSTNGTTTAWIEYTSVPETDNTTINLNSSNKLQAIGTIEKNTSSVKYDWVGTLAEWQAGRSDHSISDDWICYITDDYVPSTVTHNIGDIFYSLRDENMFNGAVVCDGSQYNIDNYSEGTESIKNLLDGGKLPYVSIEVFNATVTANGSCRCFGYDGSTATVFKVPKLNNVFIEAGVAANNSEFIEAGLPNITGDTDIYKLSYGSNTSAVNGCFSASTGTKAGSGANEAGTNTKLSFSASDSNSIYGNSDTVQPNSVKYRAFIQLASGTTDSALQTVNSIVSDVNDLQDAMEETVNYKNITNCITEIPQDIKLELNNGTLTLKAGSKVYVPNGFEQDGTTPKFDIVNVVNDLTYTVATSANSEKHFFYYNGSNFDYFTVSGATSGSTDSSAGTSWHMWYDTANNLVKEYRENGSTIAYTQSLPIAIINCENGVGCTGIDKIFNGFGYIGSTVFALPGVKGLIPDGRNNDGSLKSMEFTVSSVLTNQNTGSNRDGTYIQYYSGNLTLNRVNKNAYYYNEQENHYRRVSDGDIRMMVLIANTVGDISSFSSSSVFHALNWNDKESIASFGMPSNKYIDLTLGSSGSTYTAPANGWFVLNYKTSAASQNVSLENSTNGVSFGTYSTAANQYIKGTIPVKKNDIITLYLTSGGTAIWFRFIYTEGET